MTNLNYHGTSYTSSNYIDMNLFRSTRQLLEDKINESFFHFNLTLTHFLSSLVNLKTNTRYKQFNFMSDEHPEPAPSDCTQ